MTLDDRLRHVDQLPSIALRMGAEHLERPLLVDRVTRHQDAFRLLDHRPTAERSLQVLIFSEALQRDVDGALQLLGVGVDDVREHATPGRLVDVGRIPGREQRDDGTRRGVDDLRDQFERVIGAQPKADKRDVGVLPRSHRADFLDVDFARDHLVAETCHDGCEQLEPVPSLVRDQDTEGRDLRIAQQLRSKSQNAILARPGGHTLVAAVAC